MNASVKRCILRGGAEWAPDASASQTVYPRKQGQTPHTGASADKAATVRVASALSGECTKTQSGGDSIYTYLNEQKCPCTTIFLPWTKGATTISLHS